MYPRKKDDCRVRLSAGECLLQFYPLPPGRSWYEGYWLEENSKLSRRSRRRAGLPDTGTLVRLWRERKWQRRLAEQFIERDLWDAGLSHGDVCRELARPFWRG
jgi:uncharacterized protein YjiS (DUF1127 family)